MRMRQNGAVPVATALVATALVATALRAPRSEASGASANRVALQSLGGTAGSATAVLGNGSSFGATTTIDGRFTAFASDADNLVPSGGDTNASTDVFLRDNLNGTVTRLSNRTAFGFEPDTDSWMPTITPDARSVAFVSLADGFTADDDNFGGDLYVYDRVAKKFTRVSVANNSITGDGNDDGSDYVTAGTITADAKWGVFTTDNGLASLDQNFDYDVYLRDVTARRTVWITKSAVTGGGGGMVNPTDPPAVSANGCVVAFTSSAVDLEGPPVERLDPQNPPTDDVFVRTATCRSSVGVVTRVSVRPNGTTSSCSLVACNEQPALNASGQYVVWASRATDLVTAPPTNLDGSTYQVYRRDLSTNTTTLVSQSVFGAGNGDSRAPTISPDGCVVAFQTDATNLAFGDGNAATDIYTVDVCGGGAVSVPSRGIDVNGNVAPSNGSSRAPRFNGDATLLTFDSDATNLDALGTDDGLSTDVFTGRVGADTLGPTSLAVSGATTGYSLSRAAGGGWKAWDMSGVASYAPRFRRFTWNSATPSPWQALPGLASWTPATSGTFTGSAGHTYCWRLADALDNAANRAGAPSGQACRAVPLTVSSLAWSSAWAAQTSSVFYGGSARRATTKGATMTRTGVVAEGLALIATTGPTSGTVQVKWNGTVIRNVSLRSSTTKRQVVIALKTFPTPTSGTVQVVVTSTSKPVVLEGLGVETDG